MECKRAKRADWHQIELAGGELMAQIKELTEDYPPLMNSERWPSPKYEPPTTPLSPTTNATTSPAPLIKPTTIPPPLLASFPFPFTSDRQYDHGECASTDCPVAGLHLAGLYYHDLKVAHTKSQQTEWFGDSEAPPDVWDAVRRLEAGEGTKEARDGDEKMVREFRRCHHYLFQKGRMDSKIVERKAIEAWKDAMKDAKTLK